MGRTKRNRRKNKSHIKLLQNSSNGDAIILEQMRSWMISEGWLPDCKLVPHVFSNTGRGLKTLEDIEADRILIRIPKELLITTSTVYHSDINKIFLHNLDYEAQCVIASFLVYEKHLGRNSRWKFYIDSLPNSYTIPDYCTFAEKKCLPDFILHELSVQSSKMINNFKTIRKSIRYRESIGDNLCPHCGMNWANIFTFSAFKWGYYTVNTRTVYLDATANDYNQINIRGDDNLALAPFLDLFNHSYDASVNVSLTYIKNVEFYQIQTLKSIEKNSQVFINYGPHNSLKLYVEYGFFIPDNPLDEVTINYDRIKNFTNVSESKNQFVISNRLNTNIGFSSLGLNYHAKIIFFILTTDLKSEHWKKKIYVYDFNEEEIFNMNILARTILHAQRTEFIDKLEIMKLRDNQSESFQLAIHLLKEYISILDHCYKNIEE